MCNFILDFDPIKKGKLVTYCKRLSQAELVTTEKYGETFILHFCSTFSYFVCQITLYLGRVDVITRSEILPSLEGL